MDQCLEDLGNARDYKTDHLVIQLIHIQKFTEKIYHYHSSESVVEEQLGSPESSTMACIEAFRDELHSLRNAVPTHLKSNCIIT